MNSLTPTEELDKVLKWFAMEPDQVIDYKIDTRENVIEAYVGTDIMRYFPELYTDKYFLGNLPLILKKLHRDGYLDIGEMPTPGFDNYTTTYSINFDGKFFSQAGGYSAKETSLEARKKWEDDLLLKGEKNGERLNKLTLVLSIGTIALALIELVKFFYELPSQCH